jgi:hypothetical protein
VPSPETVAVPIVRSANEQSPGGDDCGPYATNVIVPVGLVPPDSVALIADAGTPLFVVVFGGTDTDTDVGVGGFATVVEVIPAPQPLFDARLEPSPP